MLVRGGKYLISGMGGIGKTELMRQLLWCCEEEGLADYVAMDVKASLPNYARAAGCPDLDLSRIRERIGLLKSGSDTVLNNDGHSHPQHHGIKCLISKQFFSDTHFFTHPRTAVRISINR